MFVLKHLLKYYTVTQKNEMYYILNFLTNIFFMVNKKEAVTFIVGGNLKAGFQYQH